MRSVLQATAAFLALVLALAILQGPHDSPRASTLEVLAQPEAARALEAQRLEHAREMAEIEANLADARAEQATLRLALVLLAAVVGGSVWAALAMSKRHAPAERMIVLPGSPVFDRLLAEQGGVWVDGVATWRGQEVRYLEIEDEAG